MDTKYCYVCKRQLPIAEFGKNRRKYDGLSSECRSCHKVAAAGRKEVQRQVYKDWYAKLKEANPCCVMCGENDWVCLDFHHLRDKKAQLGDWITGWMRSKKALMDEAAKCVVLCSNCHRKLHAGHLVLTDTSIRVPPFPDPPSKPKFLSNEHKANLRVAHARRKAQRYDQTHPCCEV